MKLDIIDLETGEITTPDLIPADQALLVMDCIMFEQANARKDTWAAYSHLDSVRARMAEMPAHDLADAQYHYNKATGQL